MTKNDYISYYTGLRDKYIVFVSTKQFLTVCCLIGPLKYL